MSNLVVSRRDVFAGLLAFATTAHIALPAAAALPAVAAAPAARFFAPADLAFLAAFVDTLLPATDTPGAKAANVHLGLDALMTGWASPAKRAAALATIAALRADLDRRLVASFETAPPAARTAALAAFDAAAFAGPGRAQWADYRSLKALCVRLYYTSEIGASQELRYDPLPGRYIGDLPYKTGDRPWAL